MRKRDGETLASVMTRGVSLLCVVSVLVCVLSVFPVRSQKNGRRYKSWRVTFTASEGCDGGADGCSGVDGGPYNTNDNRYHHTNVPRSKDPWSADDTWSDDTSLFPTHLVNSPLDSLSPGQGIKDPAFHRPRASSRPSDDSWAPYSRQHPRGHVPETLRHNIPTLLDQNAAPVAWPAQPVDTTQTSGNESTRHRLADSWDTSYWQTGTHNPNYDIHRGQGHWKNPHQDDRQTPLASDARFNDPFDFPFTQSLRRESQVPWFSGHPAKGQDRDPSHLNFFDPWATTPVPPENTHADPVQAGVAKRPAGRIQENDKRTSPPPVTQPPPQVPIHLHLHLHQHAWAPPQTPPKTPGGEPVNGQPYPPPTQAPSALTLAHTPGGQRVSSTSYPTLSQTLATHPNPIKNLPNPRPAEILEILPVSRTPYSIHKNPNPNFVHKIPKPNPAHKNPSFYPVHKPAIPNPVHKNPTNSNPIHKTSSFKPVHQKTIPNSNHKNPNPIPVHKNPNLHHIHRNTKPNPAHKNPNPNTVHKNPNTNFAHTRSHNLDVLHTQQPKPNLDQDGTLPPTRKTGTENHSLKSVTLNKNHDQHGTLPPTKTNAKDTSGKLATLTELVEQLYASSAQKPRNGGRAASGNPADLWNHDVQKSKDGPSHAHNDRNPNHDSTVVNSHQKQVLAQSDDSTAHPLVQTSTDERSRTTDLPPPWHKANKPQASQNALNSIENEQIRKNQYSDKYSLRQKLFVHVQDHTDEAKNPYASSWQEFFLQPGTPKQDASRHSVPVKSSVASSRPNQEDVSKHSVPLVSSSSPNQEHVTDVNSRQEAENGQQTHVKSQDNADTSVSLWDRWQTDQVLNNLQPSLTQRHDFTNSDNKKTFTHRQDSKDIFTQRLDSTNTGRRQQHVYADTASKKPLTQRHDFADTINKRPSIQEQHFTGTDNKEALTGRHDSTDTNRKQPLTEGQDSTDNDNKKSLTQGHHSTNTGKRQPFVHRQYSSETDNKNTLTRVQDFTSTGNRQPLTKGRDFTNTSERQPFTQQQYSTDSDNRKPVTQGQLSTGRDNRQPMTRSPDSPVNANTRPDALSSTEPAKFPHQGQGHDHRNGSNDSGVDLSSVTLVQVSSSLEDKNTSDSELARCGSLRPTRMCSVAYPQCSKGFVCDAQLFCRIVESNLTAFTRSEDRQYFWDAFSCVTSGLWQRECRTCGEVEGAVQALLMDREPAHNCLLQDLRLCHVLYMPQNQLLLLNLIVPFKAYSSFKEDLTRTIHTATQYCPHKDDIQVFRTLLMRSPNLENYLHLL